jgi:hypothetical protein
MPVDDTYRVPTVPVAVRLTLSIGEAEEVLLFLSMYSESHSGPETLDEFLNRDRSFLPVRSKTTDRSFIVNRSAVVAAEAGADAPVLFRLEEAVASSIDLVQVQLSNGTSVEGTLLLSAPPEHARVSDFFNRKEIFLPLETGERVVYLNKQHVVSVRL